MPLASYAQSSAICSAKADYQGVCRFMSPLDSCSEALRNFCCDCQEVWDETFEVCSFSQELFSQVDLGESPAPIPQPEAPPEPEVPSIDENGNCIIETDCIDQPLAPTACVGVNGFLKQTNIVSVTNISEGNLSVSLEYRDLFGQLRGTASASLTPLLKRDFIINDMGLEPDSYGTVCVETSAENDGAWLGGVTIYKLDLRKPNAGFGDPFEFALYYPFENPRSEPYIVPLNTFHLGTNPQATVANWISITDAVPGDGQALQGKLVYFSADGQATSEQAVVVPDGGRFDYSGHEGIAGLENIDAVGMARFVPEPGNEYLLTVARYFYDCSFGTCPDFLTAFNLPNRPGTQQPVFGGITTDGGATAVLELSSTSPSILRNSVQVSLASGELREDLTLAIESNRTQHVIVESSPLGTTFSSLQPGSVKLEPTEGFLSALSVFYYMNPDGSLGQAHATPLLSTPKNSQVTEFNSFIGHKNILEVFNPTTESSSVVMRATDFLGNIVFEQSLSLQANETFRLSPDLPVDSYGTISLEASGGGVSFNNYVIRDGEYIYTFRGK